MRGIYFPNANLIFDVQQHDPGAPKPKIESSGSSTDTYASAYSGWEIVENAAVALTDGVTLILKPGRTCQNGKPVPVSQPDFQKFAREMREAGRVALQAAKTRNQEKVSDATNNIADACSNCHEVYRDKARRQPGALHRTVQDGALGWLEPDHQAQPRRSRQHRQRKLAKDPVPEGH